jgi:hypothetical protein
MIKPKTCVLCSPWGLSRNIKNERDYTNELGGCLIGQGRKGTNERSRRTKSGFLASADASAENVTVAPFGNLGAHRLKYFKIISCDRLMVYQRTRLGKSACAYFDETGQSNESYVRQCNVTYYQF